MKLSKKKKKKKKYRHKSPIFLKDVGIEVRYCR